MISLASRDAFVGFKFTAFSAINILVVVRIIIGPCLIESSLFFFQSKLIILFYIFLNHMMSFWFDRLFMDDLSWLLFVREKKSSYGNNSKYAKAIDIIWLYCWLNWRLYCWLNWKLYCWLNWSLYCWLNWRLNGGLFFIMQYLFFSFFHECSKLMALGDTSRMFFLCYFFCFFLCHFHLTQNPRGYSFRIYKYAYFNFFNCPLAMTNSSSVNTLFLLCTILGSTLSFGYQTKIALACLLNFFWYGRMRLHQHP